MPEMTWEDVVRLLAEQIAFCGSDRICDCCVARRLCHPDKVTIGQCRENIMSWAKGKVQYA